MTPPKHSVVDLEAAVLRLAGDFGDGVNLIGHQFTSTCSALENDVFKVVEPAPEIRAPVGTPMGVVSFQVQFAAHKIYTPGDRVHTLVALNPAALRAHIGDLVPGGTLIVNADHFSPGESLLLADLAQQGIKVVSIPMQALQREAVARLPLATLESERCAAFLTLGLMCRLYERPLEPILRWLGRKYPGNPAMMDAAARTLRAGYVHAEKPGLFSTFYRIRKYTRSPGRFRHLDGKEALALGFVAAAENARHPLVVVGFPTHPASELMQRLCDLRERGLRILQAEDEAGAMGLAIGAAFGGALAVAATNGPGLAQKSEALGLAVMAELPCVVLVIQRAGPSNGMPNKTEQADLFLAVAGRSGDAPIVVLAPSSPADCFAIAYESLRLATLAMTPVIVLCDLALMNASEIWNVPGHEQLPAIRIVHPQSGARPFERDERGSRPWIIPGTPGLEHRLSGLEKEGPGGEVSYVAGNHQVMIDARQQKIARVAQAIPPLEIHGPQGADVLVIGWGSTAGALRTAVEARQRKGEAIAWATLRYLNPMPANTAELLRRFRKILVPELNRGQLLWLLRAQYLVDAVGINKSQGTPFSVAEIEHGIAQALAHPASS